MSEAVTVPPSTSKLELRTAYGRVYRDVLNTPPRDCTPEEIPVIDLTALDSPNIEDRKALASQIRAAAVNTGFFYIKNHGISETIIADAKKQLLALVLPFPRTQDSD
jgi:non-haem dioxygenase in morphine synthesis N-terminal